MDFSGKDASEEPAASRNYKIDGYLYKLEQRPIVGQMRKKYWFVLPRDSPVLYWYKNANEFNCAGRILLSGAAFIYNPREHGIFEIHVDSKCYLLEAPDNRTRLDWLSSLQQSRRQYYQRNDIRVEASSSNVEGVSCVEGNTKLNFDDLYVGGPNAVEPVYQQQSSDELEPHSSVFYLREDGELHPGSLEVPPPIHTVCDTVELKIDELINRGAEETQQLELATKRLLNKARSSFRTLSQSSQPIPINPQPREDCDRCQELVQSLEQLRNRCYELTDDLVGHQELVKTLKRSVISAHNQRDGLKRYCMDSSTDAERVAFILERESALAKIQFTLSELRRDIEMLKEQNRCLEAENTSLNITVEAYQESVRTKEELILKYADRACPPAVSSSAPIPIVVNNGSSNSPKLPSKASMVANRRSANVPIPLSTSAEAAATEALLVDFGTPTDVAAKTLFTETAVNDLNEMKDLVDGYRNQNKFLNNEVLELQKIVQSLEDRERRMIRQNFTIEAVYYQLKSRYIMLLNHFRPSADRQNRRIVEPSLIQELIDEVSRPHSPMRTHNSTSLAVETAKSPSALATLLSCPQKAIAACDDTEGGAFQRRKDPETDSLGFYLSSPQTRKTVNEYFALAGNQKLEETTTEHNRSGSEEEEEEDEVQLSDGSDKATNKARMIAADLRTLSSSNTLSQLSCDEIQKKLSAATQTEELASKIISSSSAPSTSTVSMPGSSITSKTTELKTDDWLLRMAADLKKRSDDIICSIQLGDNQEVVEWLQEWDAFLVNHVLQPMSPNPKLKALIRCGIPQAYRSRVWSSLVNFLVGSIQSETGKGYYDCLLRKANRVQEQSAVGVMEEDAALKQIDLDLVRTLPNNKLFETEHSPKVNSLKNILYAFRFHNRSVEYCQGLNRLGAIGLLYLDESQAFWFLVACVDFLQPPNYYSPSLLGAVIDQRVLLDLVQDKMPSLHSHLQKLEVDLSLFTLSWFLTIFVDVLSHNIYIKIFDVFLLEGNKVLFRFALAILKLVESRIMECTSLSGIQNCLSNLSSLIIDFKTLSHIAFNCLNPFPAKSIENRRQNYYAQYKNGKMKC